LIVSAVAALAVAAAPLDVAVQVTPRAVPFGDAVEARATIVVDTRSRDPNAVVVRFAPGPFEQLGERREWSRSDASAVLRLRVRIACRSAACAPTERARTVRLPALVVNGRAVRWPTVDVLPRVPAAAVAANPPPFVADASPPPPTFRVDPDSAVTLLAVLALLLAAGGATLLALEGRAALAARPRQTGTPLERALARVRASLAARPGERRRAVGALARLVEPANPPLGRTAAELAWAEPQPEGEDVEALASRVEREVLPW
jgi:hypothetical protein